MPPTIHGSLDSDGGYAPLLPVGYFHLEFTLPGPIADIAHQNKTEIYGLLFTAAVEAPWNLWRKTSRPLGKRPAAALAAISSHMSNGFFSRFASSSGTSLPPAAAARSCAMRWIRVGSLLGGASVGSAVGKIAAGAAAPLGSAMPRFLA